MGVADDQVAVRKLRDQEMDAVLEEFRPLVLEAGSQRSCLGPRGEGRIA